PASPWPRCPPAAEGPKPRGDRRRHQPRGTLPPEGNLARSLPGDGVRELGADTAIGHEDLPRDVLREITGQKQQTRRDVGRIGDAPQRRVRLVALTAFGTERD